MSLTDEIEGLAYNCCLASLGFAGGPAYYALHSRLESLESELNDLRKDVQGYRLGEQNRQMKALSDADLVARIHGHSAREGQYDPDKFRIGDIQRFEFSDLIEQPSGLPCSGPIELGNEDGG